MDERNDEKRRRQRSWIAAALLAGGILALGALMWGIAGGDRALLGGPEKQPAVPIGGDFTLTAHTGETVTAEAFRGDLMLVYFGYTYCPDVCPGALEVMSIALDRLGEKAAAVTPVFITVDPARDTPAVIAEYLSNFHPRFVGLTGTPEQIEEAAKAYRIYYSKAENDGAEDAEYYLMDHSSVIYLMDRDGTYLAHFTHATAPDEMAGRIEPFL